MKYLLVSTLLLLAGALIYWRLRPYLMMARRIFGAMRQVSLMNSPEENAAARARQYPRQSNEKLIRCASCGTWTLASRAILMRASHATYCSHTCLEQMANQASATRKSAS